MQAIARRGWFAQINSWYKYAEHHCSCTPLDITLHAIDLSGWQSVIEKVAKDLHEGNLKPNEISPDLVSKTFAELNSAAGTGYGKDWKRLGNDAGADKAVLEMKRNIYRFSGAKTYTQLLELNSNLYQDGKVKPFAQFKEDALKINEKYNTNYLQAEWQTSRQSGHHARMWKDYLADAKLFPNLKYKTVGDSRVRDSHRVLDNIVAPLDSPFWMKYYFPNGYRCRCYGVQTAEKATADIPDEVPEIKPEFRNNVGISHQIFNEGTTGIGKAHPYFAILSTDHEALSQVEKQLVKNFREEVRDWAKKEISSKKQFTNKDLEQGFSINNTEIRSITGKPHEDQFGRNNLIYNLDENFGTAEFIKEAPEEKTRTKYKRWLYFKDKSGNYYYNIAEMADGKYVLHSITDKIR